MFATGETVGLAEWIINGQSFENMFYAKESQSFHLPVI